MTDITEYNRLIPVAEKAMHRMAGIWALTAAETQALLSGRTPREVIERTGAALCVWKHVSWRFRDHGASWMRQPNAVYRGVTPLTLLTSPDLADARRLREAFDSAEMKMLSGYAVPEYPVQGYACETPEGVVAMITTNLRFAGPAPRDDGGPGRFATNAELQTALAATEAVDEPVISYLRDK